MGDGEINEKLRFRMDRHHGQWAFGGGLFNVGRAYRPYVVLQVGPWEVSFGWL